jgi:histidinol-phosphate aminotransferase
VKDAGRLFQYLIDEKVIVRDRSRVIRCDDCLRITVGNEEENRLLLNKMNAFPLKSTLI